jgi:PiT family inorganic phosphate transporter
VSANLITALLVLVASNFGMPVSTTHVSVGTIAGVGASANTLDKSVFRNVLLSWLATLPISAAAAFAAGWML